MQERRGAEKRGEGACQNNGAVEDTTEKIDHRIWGLSERDFFRREVG
jgi:hypothetical protein